MKIKGLVAALFIFSTSLEVEIIEAQADGYTYGVQDRVSTGTLGALNAAVTLPLEGTPGAGGYLALGTLSGTVTPEALVNTTWVPISFLTWSAGSAPTRAATINASTLFQLDLPAGARQARIRVSSYTSGSGTGTLVGTASDGVDGGTTVSGTVTANQGTPASTANRWPVQLTDGTDLALVSAAGELNVLATAQPGVDIGDVTINNGAGAAAVNIQDGGNVIDVQGTVTADTELPAAAALADNTPNPTAPAVGAFNLWWDGANWDRGPGNSTDGLLVNLGANNDVTIPANSSVNLAQVAGTNTVTGGTAGSLGVGGTVAHDAVGTSVNPLLEGGYASAAAPSDVSGDGDAVRAWNLRNGARAIQETYAGVLSSVDAGVTGTGTKRVIQASNSTLTVAAANNDGACVTITATSGTVLASNAARRGLVLIARTSNTAEFFVKFGATATTSDFPLAPGASITMMAGSLTYTGVIDGIRSGLVADQTACVVEF